ncbi:alpha/beta hydrolase [Micromonospora sp. M12]
MTALRTVTVDGSPVHVLESGTGPAVLMLHGSGPGTTGSGAWATTAEALGASWHLVAPDQAGFGRTPVPAGSRGGLRLWTEQAAGLMDALGIEHYAVVGHSMGGAVALALAAARPSRSPVSWRSRRWAPRGAAVRRPRRALGRPAGPLGARDMLSRLVLDQALVTDSAVDARAAAMRAGRPHSRRCSLHPGHDGSTISPSRRKRWQRCARPCCSFTAPRTGSPARDGSRPLLAHLADVRLHVLGRCGHVPAVEHPHEFRQLLSCFLRQGRGH